MIVIVKMFDGKRYVLSNIDAGMTVESLCVRIRGRASIHPSVPLSVTLKGEGDVEDSTATLADYNIVNESTLYVSRLVVLTFCLLC